MNKYYHRGGRECVLPDPEQTNHFVYMSSLPVAATLDFDAPVGWVDSFLINWQFRVNETEDWRSCTELQYYELYKDFRRRILLVKADEGEREVDFSELDPSVLTKPMSDKKEEWEKYFIRCVESDSVQDLAVVFEAIWQAGAAWQKLNP